MADFPEPVDITHSVSRPPTTASTASSWPGRRSSNPSRSRARFRMVVAISSMGMGTALKEQRRNLPDSPGVYLFRDRKGGVIYVGKAKSIRKRVNGHFSNRVTRGDTQMVELAEAIDFVSVGTEAEALLAEQEFIKRYQPRFNIRLRDDKSYPYIAISMDEEFPRVYFTRERHRRDRLYFGPYSSAKRTRSTLDTLGKIFMYRSCNGTVPGRRSGSPCLDYYIRRCGAPCVGYVTPRSTASRSTGGRVS
jgi:excinuclease ABC subunit C